MRRISRVVAEAFLMFVIATISFSLSALADTNYITGPSAVTVAIGNPIRVDYKVELPRRYEYEISYLTSNPEVTNGSSKV